MVFARGQSDDGLPTGGERRAGGGGLHHPHDHRQAEARVQPVSQVSGLGGPGHRLNLLLSSPAWRTDSWADRLPQLLEPMGVSSVRAASAREAERVMRQVSVHLAVVDLTVPLDGQAGENVEEGGTRILELLSRLESPPPTVVIQAPRTSRDSQRSMTAALRCGAFAVVDHSAADLELLLGVMQRCLSKFYQNQWPGQSSPGPSGLC